MTPFEAISKTTAVRNCPCPEQALGALAEHFVGLGFRLLRVSDHRLHQRPQCARVQNLVWDLAQPSLMGGAGLEPATPCL
jgi:hypothetical protein